MLKLKLQYFGPRYEEPKRFWVHVFMAPVLTTEA